MPPKKKSAEEVDLSALRDEVANLSRILNGKFSQLEKAVSEVKEGQQGILNCITFLNAKFEEMKKTTERLEGENHELKQKNQQLEGRVDDLTHQINDLDQYHRRVNLEIAGVPEEKGENPEKIVLKIAQKITEDVSAGDIDIAHRIGKEDDQRGPRPIIVRFTNRRSRNMIYDGRRKLQHFTTKDFGLRSSSKGNGRIYVNENLVASTRELLKETNRARRLAGYKYLWTHNGRIYVKKNDGGAISVINRKEDLSKLQ
ncbi:uncharacterized protein [Diadema setosum]|uniref:uncharacterized protein n=2 Tax=Diadema setosum TaxID=31175 RepID=UPI003B3A38D6